MRARGKGKGVGGDPSIKGVHSAGGWRLEQVDWLAGIRVLQAGNREC